MMPATFPQRRAKVERTRIAWPLVCLNLPEALKHPKDAVEKLPIRKAYGVPVQTDSSASEQRGIARRTP